MSTLPLTPVTTPALSVTPITAPLLPATPPSKYADYVVVSDGTTAYAVAHSTGFASFADATNDAAAVTKSALTALGAAGGSVLLLGTLAWKSVATIPPSITGRLQVYGLGNTKIVLSSGGPRVFDWGKVSDYDIFQHVDVGDFDVDCNSIGGRHHVVVGPWQGGTWQRKINLDDVHIHDVRILNAPVGSDANTDFRIGVHIGMAASVASDTLCTATNCSVKRISSDGCLQLVAVHGVPVGAEATANIFHDDILVEDITHDLPTTPSAANSGAHVMAGTKGTGGTITIRRVRGRNSLDVGIEWDGWQNAILDDNVIEDAYDADYYHVNYNLPANPEAQLSTLTNCIARKRLLSDHGQGFAVAVANGNRPGSLVFGDGCLFHRMATAGGFQATPIVGAPGEAFTLVGPRRIAGTIRCVMEYPDYSGSPDVSPTAVWIEASSTTDRSDVDLDVRVKATGSRSGTGLIDYRSFVMREGLLSGFRLDIESDVAFTGLDNSIVQHVQLGSVSGGELASTLSGRLRVTVPSNGGGGGNIPVGIKIESESFNSIAANEELIIHDCNFAGIAATSTDVAFGGTGTLQTGTRYRNNKWRSFPQDRRTVSATTNLDGRADYVGVTPAAGLTVSLPSAAKTPVGRIIRVVDEAGTAGTNAITVSAQGSAPYNAINGGATVSLSTNYASASFVNVGTGIGWVRL